MTAAPDRHLGDPAAWPERFGGACLCGAVRFRVDARPKWVAYCHCTQCRRAHGASPVAWVGVHRASFPREGTVGRFASSPPAHRSFCTTCGSSMFFESERWADEVHIALGVVSTEEGSALVPRSHVFWDDRAPWVRALHEGERDGLPKKGGPNGTTLLQG